MPAPLRTARVLHLLNRALRWVFLAALGTALLLYVRFTWHWPMLVNSPVMHYVVFLMRHGLRPYVDITDMNMPGAYLLERAGIGLFGAGDLSWRLYDLFLEAVLMASMVVIARPSDRLAGIYAGGLFALQHGSEGAWFMGEREQEMAVLLVASCALLFVAVRRERPILCAGFGFLAGLAASIKPTLVPFGVASLLLLGWTLRRHRRPAAPYLLWGAGGLLSSGALTLLFLWRYGALHSFLFLLRTVTPVYSGLSNPARHSLLVYAVPRTLAPLVVLGAIGLLGRRQWNWERSVLLLGTACGLLSYVIQRKGFWYQRYTFLAFGLLLVSLEIFPSMKSWKTPVWIHAVSLLSLLYAVGHILPSDLRVLWTRPGASALTAAMEGDLRTLGGDRLQREVQCFDVTFGCLNSLYHLGLVENTGFTGDMLLFPSRPNPASNYYRDLFWRLEAAHPASVIVFTSQDFGHPNSYRRLALWPEFSRYLAENYTLAVARSFPFEDKPRGAPPDSVETAFAYRMYVRKGVALPSLPGSGPGTLQ